MTAEAVWDFHSKEPQLAEIPFEQFEARLRDHRDQAWDKWLRSATEEMAMVHDRRLHPRKTHNDKGEKVLGVSPEAKVLLRKDVKDKKDPGKPQ